MKDSDYIVIDTPELKALFAPKQATDEIEWNGSQIWEKVCNEEEFSQDRKAHYRRLRSRAWLKIADKPVQFPCWAHNEAVYSRPVYCDKELPYHGTWTIWQPAPAAPDPPSDSDIDGWKMVAADYFFANCHKAMDKDALLKLFDEAVKAGRAYERSKPKPLAR